MDFIFRAARLCERLLGRSLWRFIKQIIRHAIAFTVLFGVVRLVEFLIGNMPETDPASFLYRYVELGIGFLFLAWTIFDVIKEFKTSIKEIFRPRTREPDRKRKSLKNKSRR